MYGLFTHIRWNMATFKRNVGKYSLHGSYGYRHFPKLFLQSSPTSLKPKTLNFPLEKVRNIDTRPKTNIDIQ